MSTHKAKKNPEALRLGYVRAQHRALDLHREVRSKKVKREDFFTKDVIHVQSMGRPIPSVGTDCSGVEVPIQALKILKIPHRHLFSCDNNPIVQQTIKSNWAPQQFFPDVTKRDNLKAPGVDIYIAGFPCQPFSSAGKQQGFRDAKGRGEIFFKLLQYIKTKLPKVFILENVKGFTELENGKALRTALKELHKIKYDGSDRSIYEIHHEVLNTKDFGIPQHRPRWYCIGIRRTALKGSGGSVFTFPTPIPCPKIDDFLDHPSKQASGATWTELTETAKKNITSNIKYLQSRDCDPETETHIVDCDASSTRTRSMVNISPCITRARWKGHWITNQRRRMTLTEMM